MESLVKFVKQYWLIMVLIVVGMGLVFFFGEWLGDSIASSRYKKEMEATLKKSAEHEAKAAEFEKREAVLAERNKILKQQNEAQAILLTGHGNKELAKAADNVKKIAEDKEEQLEKIANTPDEEQQCDMCKDARASGIEFEMCAGICN